MKKLALAAILSAFLISCEKNIDFDLDIVPEVLVVDAQIESGKPPFVILTKSLSYFSNISTAILDSAFVHNAQVFLSNGQTTHQLKEYTYPLIPGFSYYVYSIDSSNLSTAFEGEYDHAYHLRIVAEGKEYTSDVTIPALNTFPDSVWFIQAPQHPDTSRRVMFILQATDPPGLGNYIRYFTKKNSEPFFPGENSVFSDQVIDGTTYQVQLPPGFNRNDRPVDDSLFFKRADTVTLKICNIDLPTYTFWSTWEFAFQGIGNPFTQPNKVTGNISNGALGAFCGYASWYGTYIVN